MSPEPPKPASTGFRVPYPILGAVVTIVVALCSGWGATSMRLGGMEAKQATMETRMAQYERENSGLREELKEIKKQRAEDMAVMTGQNRTLFETLTQLRVTVAEQK